jgi:hypothetical protein
MRLTAVLLISAIAAPALAQQQSPSSSGIDWSKPVIVDAPTQKSVPVEAFAIPIEVFTAKDLKTDSSAAAEFARSLSVTPEACRWEQEGEGRCMPDKGPAREPDQRGKLDPLRPAQ